MLFCVQACTFWAEIASDTINKARNLRMRVKTESVMTTLRKVSDFIYFLPFLLSLYHHPEPSRTFYDNPLTSAMTHTPDHPSMT